MKSLNLVVPCCPGLQAPGPAALTGELNVPGSQASRMPIVNGSDCARADEESRTKQASIDSTRSGVIDEPPLAHKLIARPRKPRRVRAVSGITLHLKRLVSSQIMAGRTRNAVSDGALAAKRINGQGGAADHHLSSTEQPSRKNSDTFSFRR